MGNLEHNLEAYLHTSEDFVEGNRTTIVTVGVQIHSLDNFNLMGIHSFLQ